MSYFRQFEQSNPLTFCPPAEPLATLPEIAARARRLLTERTLAQVIEIAESADWMIDSAVEEAVEAAASEEDGVEPERHERSDAMWLDGCIDYYDLATDLENGSSRDYEYFSVLALWKVVDAVLALHPADEGQISPLSVVAVPSSSQIAAAADSAVAAMEAVCIGERRQLIGHLTNVWRKHPSQFGGAPAPSTDEQVRQKISVQARKAAIRKHADDYAMRARAIELYKTRRYPSVEAAAQAIAPQVCKSPRTVARWLYDERKGRTPPTPEVTD